MVREWQQADIVSIGYLGFEMIKCALAVNTVGGIADVRNVECTYMLYCTMYILNTNTTTHYRLHYG